MKKLIIFILASVTLVGCSETNKISLSSKPNTSLEQINYSQPKNNLNKETKSLYQKAEQGDAVAQYKLGLLYEYGDDINQSYTEASKWYERASIQEHSLAQERLSRLYAKGQGVLQNNEKAFLLKLKSRANVLI